MPVAYCGWIILESTLSSGFAAFVTFQISPLSRWRSLVLFSQSRVITISRYDPAGLVPVGLCLLLPTLLSGPCARNDRCASRHPWFWTSTECLLFFAPLSILRSHRLLFPLVGLLKNFFQRLLLFLSFRLFAAWPFSRILLLKAPPPRSFSFPSSSN